MHDSKHVPGIHNTSLHLSKSSQRNNYLAQKTMETKFEF